MKNLKTFLLVTAFFALMALLYLSCKKDNTVSAQGTVNYSGNIAADGCGWTIRIEDESYSPDNLNQEFSVNNLKVSVEYRLTGKRFQCGMLPDNLLRIVHITSIKRAE